MTGEFQIQGVHPINTGKLFTMNSSAAEITGDVLSVGKGLMKLERNG